MGVTGLWSIVQPCARPTKIETLNRKRLAVDASIWIYQFLKAVRDKEGNALRNSHVVGFFRRICKLLFIGIKPVFVFDGGAPALKRSVIRERKRRREGRREDAANTAAKLLAVQMQRRAEEEESKRREVRDNGDEEEVPDNLVYVEELTKATSERQQNRSKFKKKDAYHLPDLATSMHDMGGPNDPRVMSMEELQDYAKQFTTGEGIDVYDFSKIDYDSAFFTSLPASDRYNILNAARLRSRLRMGHSKEQLDTMFPDRMAFSKFQIERVTERNELTQRLMHVNEGGDGVFDSGARIAGEKGREYVLVKNDGVEGGWALGVVSNEGRSANEAIDLDEAPVTVEKSDSSDDEEFEDVAIEGLNRLPKQNVRKDDEITKQRRAFYRSRKANARKPVEDPDSLFVAEEPEIVENADEDEDEDEQLRRAIAMSMQQDEQDEDNEPELEEKSGSEAENDMLEVFQQSAVSEALPVPKGSGRSIANIVNRRAFHTAPESHEVTSFGVPVSKQDDSDDDTMDLQAALAESRRNKRKSHGPRYNNVQPHTPTKKDSPSKPDLERSATEIAKEHGFSGPLPFEKLDLGASLLGKKKSEKEAGGFEPETKKSEPPPPWFSGDLKEDLAKQRIVEDKDRQDAKDFEKYQFQQRDAPLRRFDTGEVIDLEEEPKGFKNGEVIDLDAEVAVPSAGAAADDKKIERFEDVAEDVRADPPVPGLADVQQPASSSKARVPFQDDLSDEEAEDNPEKAQAENAAIEEKLSDEDEPLDWSESEDEQTAAIKKLEKKGVKPAGGSVQQNDITSSMQPPDTAEQQPIDDSVAQRKLVSRSPSAEFEDVAIPDQPEPVRARKSPAQESPKQAATLLPQESVPEEFDDFSDPEDEELLRALAQEAEEHARFESSLNNKPVAQTIADYEKELRQLRTQQKKDRRDADEVTHIMITECQQLLQLFGLPYITAPMEAEAQCAELVRLGLVDGIVTDDSDCFLFGGTRIYKNMFNQAKFVECYLISDLEKEFDLTRDKLISVAHLLGSDYTEGLPGVGPVTALEILAEFGDLKSFKKWWTGVQDLSITKSDDAFSAFRKKFRKNATKLFLPPAFPDERVSIAYNTPEVDASAEQFQWGVPDLSALRAYLMATIGWSQERTDEVLVPVIKDMNRKMDEGTQSNITAFFEGGIGAGAAEAFAPRKKIDGSKRMGKAMGLMADQAKNRKRSVDAVDDESQAPEVGALRNGDESGEEFVPAKPKRQRKSKK